MPKRVTTRDGDVLDELVWQHYGRSDVITAVLEANPHLAQISTRKLFETSARII